VKRERKNSKISRKNGGAAVSRENILINNSFSHLHLQRRKKEKPLSFKTLSRLSAPFSIL
jgi:hypothetical protein